MLSSLSGWAAYAAATSLNNLSTAPGVGGDSPEAGWEAIYQIASGLGLTGVMSATIPAFDPASAPPLPVERASSMF